MKQRKTILIAPCVTLVAIWTIARLTNALAFYKVPTMANFPTIKPGDRIFGSSLLTAKRFDFITFYVNGETGKEIRTNRICGLQGDTIEIKGGDLYINGKYSDSGLTLGHYFKLPTSELEKVQKLVDPKDASSIYSENDSLTANLADADIKLNSLKAVRVLQSPTERNEEVGRTFKTSNNADYFGPVVVPPNKYFVLGDNRSSAQDSRYLGFIDKADYITTVFNKK